MRSTSESNAAPRSLRFGPGARFELRPGEYRLLVDGQPAALGGRALDLLIALAARPSELLTKNELLDTVWPGLVVEENNLRVQINALRRVLGEESIATVPGRGYRLSAVIRREHEEGPARPDMRPTTGELRAPSAPRLFGREQDLAQLNAYLQARSTCVTIVGMPGVGKSSLARVARAQWLGRTAWVDLAHLQHGAQLAGALARALDVQLQDGDTAAQLLAALGEEESLLVLDNAEHLIDVCAEWVSILTRNPPTRVLVTSQLPLAVTGEQVLRLDPLYVGPSTDTPDMHDGAVAMLVERIAAADGRYAVTPAAMPLLNAVCRQLDGLPLALEMAAARVPLMGLKAVHDALEERFALLSRPRRNSPARHRTLHEALQWSYGLLDEDEQGLFRALGVFAGGFTLDLAVGLTVDEHVGRWDIVDGLATLVERSLVAVSGQDPPRYHLLETMRAFALERLAARPQGADEHRSLVRRHASAVLALFVGDESDETRLAEMENARVAFLWARDNDLTAAAQLSAHAAQTIGFSVWRPEVTDWMLSLEPAMRGAPARSVPVRTQALWWSMLAYVLNVRRSRTASEAARMAVSLWQDLDEPDELLNALVHWVRSIPEPVPELDVACAELQRLAARSGKTPKVQLRVQGALAEAARVRGDFEALLAHREQEVRMSRELGWTEMAQAAESNVCAALIELGRHRDAAERARSLLQRIDATDTTGNGNLPWVLNILVEAYLRLERLAEARALVPRSISAGKRFGTTVAWQGILGLVAAQGRMSAAARLLGYAHRLWSAHGAAPDADEQARMAQVRALVETRLGAEHAASLVLEGGWLEDEAAAQIASADAD